MWCKKENKKTKAWRPHGRDAASLTWCSVVATQINADSATVAQILWERLAQVLQIQGRKKQKFTGVLTGTHEICSSMSKNVQFIPREKIKSLSCLTNISQQQSSGCRCNALNFDRLELIKCSWKYVVMITFFFQSSMIRKIHWAQTWIWDWICVSFSVWWDVFNAERCFLSSDCRQIQRFIWPKWHQKFENPREEKLQSREWIFEVFE